MCFCSQRVCFCINSIILLFLIILCIFLITDGVYLFYAASSTLPTTCPFIIVYSLCVVFSHYWISSNDFSTPYLFTGGMHHMRHPCFHIFTGYITNTLLACKCSYTCSPCTDGPACSSWYEHILAQFNFSIDTIPTTLCAESMYHY